MTDEEMVKAFKAAMDHTETCFSKTALRLDEVIKRLDGLTTRIGLLEQGTVGLRKEAALVHSQMADLNGRMDGQERRLDRIEKGLARAEVERREITAIVVRNSGGEGEAH